MRLQRFARFFQAEGLEVDVACFADAYQEALSVQAHVLEGARELPEALKDRFHLALVTNGIASIQTPRLERSGPRAFFQAVVMSEEDGHAKPRPAFFERALRMTGRPRAGNVLMVGDNWEADIVGAHRMGMATCWYNPGRARCRSPWRSTRWRN